jgi:hypothetical protein
LKYNTSLSKPFRIELTPLPLCQMGMYIITVHTEVYEVSYMLHSPADHHLCHFVWSSLTWCYWLQHNSAVHHNLHLQVVTYSTVNFL